MSSLNDHIRDATRDEQQQLDTALLRGEHLRWATRPVPTAWTPITIMQLAAVLPMLAFMAFWTYGALGSPESLDEALARDTWQLAFAAFSLPFWLFALGMLCAPWMQKRKMGRTVYAVTDRRALIIERKLLSWNIRPFTLADNMVEERHIKGDGRGDLILGKDIRRGSERDFHTKVGFMNLPDLRLAEEKLDEAIRARKEPGDTP